MKGEKNMGEAFRQGMYIYVGGFLFCIASVVLSLLVSGIIDMNRNIRTARETVYDASAEYHYYDRGFSY